MTKTKIENLIKEHNVRENKRDIRRPNLKVVVTGTKYGYKREDRVLVISIGCLKD